MGVIYCFAIFLLSRKFKIIFLKMSLNGQYLMCSWMPLTSRETLTKVKLGIARASPRCANYYCQWSIGSLDTPQ